MLKLLNPDTKESLPLHLITFSASSYQIVQNIDRDPKHDRVMELGAQCGDLLIENMVRLNAMGVADRLAGDIYPPERQEAFLLGVRNGININLEQRARASETGVAA